MISLAAMDFPRAVQVIPTTKLGGVEVAAQSAADAGVIEIIALNRCGPFGLRSIRAARAAIRADVAIFSLWKSVGALAIARLLRPSGRLVVIVHTDRPAHFVDGLATWAMCRLASEVWGDCRQVLVARRRIVGRKPTRAISFLPSRAAPAASEAPIPRFVFWGRLDPVKRLREAVGLIAALRKRGVPAELDIYGPDCGDEASARQAIQHRGLEGAVRVHGPVDHGRLAELARGKSFFVLLSQQEGAAMSALEAMQLGLVPVVTPVGAMEQYGRFGHAYSDSERAARWIETLLNDPARYRRMSRTCSAFASARPIHSASLGEAIQRA
jgi:glycosyltransferase involved in cell wall biosynthesis